jgi:hypothetical protein
MLNVLARIQQLEAKATPSGMLLQPWSTSADGLAYTMHAGRRMDQEPGEALDDCLKRFAAHIGRSPLVFVSPLDQAL